MEDFGRRAEDKGKESNRELLVRIDERQKNHIDILDRLYVSFEEHKKDDDKKFNFINRLVYIAVGGLGMLQIIIGWVHK